MNLNALVDDRAEGRRTAGGLDDDARVAPDRYVQLFIGTGHSFTVAVHPSRVRPGAVGPVSDEEWRPGIVLGTMGK